MATLQISFRHLDRSLAAEGLIERRAAELEQFSDRITACRVVVDTAHNHHPRSRPYHVRIDLTVPGGPIVVNHDLSPSHAYDDLHIAIGEAFDAARRRLQDHMRRLDGENRPRMTDGGDLGET